jgi:hypothetical protein
VTAAGPEEEAMGANAPRLGAADTAWWRMEEPANPMVITAVLTFGARVEPGCLEGRVRERLLPLPPFRGRLREPPLGLGRPRWAPDPAFSLERHLRRVSLPAPAGDAELQALVSEVMSEPLDRRHPLWRLYLVENHAGGSALVARLHHCIADGMALIQLLLALDDLSGNEGPAHLASHDHARAGARGAGAFAAALGRLVLLPPDPRTPLAGRLGARKAAAWCDPFPLAELKAAARASGSTLNDVLGAAAAGALRRYLAGRGRAADGVGLRAVVPVDLRPRDDASLLGNRFGLVFLSLPVGVADPGERLARVRAEMRRLKASCEAGVTYTLLRVFGPAGRTLVRFAVWFLGRKASLVFTDVPGPREPVTFCGAPLARLMAWVPQSGRLSVGISAVSYAGRLQVGIAADRGLVPDPEALVDAFRQELRELLARAPAPALQEA